MKKYIWFTVIIVAALVVGGVVAVSDITEAQYTGATPAAQVALDTTVMDKIIDAEPYTGGMNGFLFIGKDKLGRELYVWTEDQKVVAMQYASAGLTQAQAIAAVKKPVLAKNVVPSMQGVKPQPMADVIHIAPGPVLPRMWSDPNKMEFRTADSRYVWEVYGKLQNGQYGYTYLDFKSGEVLWQFALAQPK